MKKTYRNFVPKIFELDIRVKFWNIFKKLNLYLSENELKMKIFYFLYRNIIKIHHFEQLKAKTKKKFLNILFIIFEKNRQISYKYQDQKFLEPNFDMFFSLNFVSMSIESYFNDFWEVLMVKMYKNIDFKLKKSGFWAMGHLLWAIFYERTLPTLSILYFLVLLKSIDCK